MLAVKFSAMAPIRAPKTASIHVKKPLGATPARKLGFTAPLMKVREATIAKAYIAPLKFPAPIAPLRISTASIQAIPKNKRERREYSTSHALITDAERFAEGSTMWGMVVALLLGASWMLYEDEVNAAEEAKKAAPASSAAAPAKQAAASAPAAAKAPETPSRFNLYECQVLTPWQRFIMIAVTLCTAGVGLFVLYPLFHFNFLKENTERAHIEGRKLKFTGDLTEFWILYLENTLLTVVTLGIYSALGHSERKIAKYIDSHLQYA